MIVDTSAIVAISMAEPDARDYLDALQSNRGRMSSATYLETAIVIDRRKRPSIGVDLDALIRRVSLTIVPFTPEHAATARQAYRDFGKGSGHPAQLNFGDCFSYALALESGEALLYKGDDFVHTGIRSALPSP